MKKHESGRKLRNKKNLRDLSKAQLLPLKGDGKWAKQCFDMDGHPTDFLSYEDLINARYTDWVDTKEGRQ